MPLHQAVFSGRLDAVIQLVQAGADVDAQDLEKLTPLQYCKGPGDIAGKPSGVPRLFMNHHYVFKAPNRTLGYLSPEGSSNTWENSGTNTF